MALYYCIYYYIVFVVVVCVCVMGWWNNIIYISDRIPGAIGRTHSTTYLLTLERKIKKVRKR